MQKATPKPVAFFWTKFDKKPKNLTSVTIDG